MKKVFAICTLLLLTLSAFAGGSQEVQTVEPEGGKPVLNYVYSNVAFNPEEEPIKDVLEEVTGYEVKYNMLPAENPAMKLNLEQEWSRLDGFTRYSNVSAADYHEMRLRMLDTLGWPADGEKLSAAQLEYLAELEHIRWCRYHYLNNWRWGKPENGARKDPAKRIHADLIPYGELSDQEKQKDRDNIHVLLSTD